VCNNISYLLLCVFIKPGSTVIFPASWTNSCFPFGGLYLTLNFIPAIHHHQRKVKKSKKRKEKTQIRTHPTAIACYMCVKKSFWLLAFSLQAFCPKPWYWDSDHGLTAAEIAACFETCHFFLPRSSSSCCVFIFGWLWLAMAGCLPIFLCHPQNHHRLSLLVICWDTWDTWDTIKYIYIYSMLSFLARIWLEAGEIECIIYICIYLHGFLCWRWEREFKK